jgi:hypothetical protein
MAADESQTNTRVTIDRKNIPRSPNFVDIYANDTYVQTSQWDMRLMFAILTEQGTDQGTPAPLRIADVRLSLQHAKRVAQLMTMQIAQYERDFGPLAVPVPANEEG